MNYSELKSKIEEIEKKAKKDIEEEKLKYLESNQLKIGSIINSNNTNYKIVKLIKYELNGFLGVCIVYRVEVLKKDSTPLKNPKLERFNYYPSSSIK